MPSSSFRRHRTDLEQALGALECCSGSRRGRCRSRTRRAHLRRQRGHRGAHADESTGIKVASTEHTWTRGTRRERLRASMQRRAFDPRGEREQQGLKCTSLAARRASHRASRRYYPGRGEEQHRCSPDRLPGICGGATRWRPASCRRTSHLSSTDRSLHFSSAKLRHHRPAWALLSVGDKTALVRGDGRAAHLGAFSIVLIRACQQNISDSGRPSPQKPLPTRSDRIAGFCRTADRPRPVARQDL